MSEYIQKGYIRNADIMPIQDDMRIADIPKLSEIASSPKSNESEKINLT